jgi:hypothetical protein
MYSQKFEIVFVWLTPALYTLSGSMIAVGEIV